LRLQQRDMSEAAKGAISKQNIATFQHRVQRDDAAHVVLKQWHPRGASSSMNMPVAAPGVERAHEFGAGITDTRFLS